MRSIKLLPESVRSSMRSGIILFDLTKVVEELVFNSLDAGATRVIVAVGVGTNYIKVTDNGYGITRDELVLLGERYATSKFEQLPGLNTAPESFGFRGESLSSISDVSLLEVFTKAHGMPNGYRKVIKNCKCLYLGIDDNRQDVGTTVVVRDLFYNQPVKRRHLKSSPKKVLHSVKECILKIALVHLSTCFKVFDIESGDELLGLYPSSSPLPLLARCFGIEDSHSLHKLDESDGKLKLSGYISGPYGNLSVKAFQYFYINSRYISRGPLHRLLNQLAAMNDCSDLSKADIRSQCGKRSRFQASPIYILNLTCPRAHYDLSFEPAKTCVEFKDWDPVFTFIKKSVTCFWSAGACMSKEDDIWNGADIFSNGNGNNDRLPKKKCMTKCNQDSIILSSPLLEMPRKESKHAPLVRFSGKGSQSNAVKFEDFRYITSEDTYSDNKEHMDLLSDTKWHPNSLHNGCSTSNQLLLEQAYPVSSHVDNDLMKPFLRSCSSGIIPLHAKSNKGDDKFRFQADKFKKWLCMDDNEEETDYNIQDSEPWLDDGVTIWSPPRMATSFDTLLTGGDCLTEDNSYWASPVESNKFSKSSHRSSKGDWSAFGEKVQVEPLTDIVLKRHFDQGKNYEFDLFALEEIKKGFFNSECMRHGSSWEDFESLDDCNLSHDFLYESDWTRSPLAASHHVPSLSCADKKRSKVGQCRILDKKRRRSCSAPPFYKEKKKIIALNSWMADKSEKFYHETLQNTPSLQEASHLKHTEKLSANGLRSKDRHDKQKIADETEILDNEGKVDDCYGVYNTDSYLTLKENSIGRIDFGVKWRNGCPLSSSIQKPNDLANQEKILDISSGVLNLSGEALLPKSTSKKCLEDCRVLYQVDKKFIPVVGGGILAIIDQHAADERIRLEDLREKVLSGETKTVTYLDAEQELVIPEIGHQLLNNYSEQIQKWGWICNFHAKSSVSFKKCHVFWESI